MSENDINLIPIQVKGGVKRTTADGRDTEGTEVVVKCVKLVPLKRFLSTKMVEQEEQFTLFFPKVSIHDIKDVKGIYDFMVGSRLMEKAPGIWAFRCENAPSLYISAKFEEMWDRSEWQDIKKFDEVTGEVWVFGEPLVFGKFYCPDLCDKLRQVRQELLQQVMLKAFEERKEELEYYERVGRYEKAAELYEILGMLEKAREMRNKKREAKVVQLDLNQLIRQLGELGFTITYHCSHCGAPVSINGETKAESVQYCSHCGSRIETIDLANFIKKYLS